MGCLKLIYREEKPTLKVLKNTFTSSYRYGFIGQENDNEVNGVNGGSQDHKFRSYDSRIGRYKSRDPLANDYAHNSPYAYAENRVIDGIDLEGRELNLVIQNFDNDGYVQSVRLIRHIGENGVVIDQNLVDPVSGESYSGTNTLVMSINPPNGTPARQTFNSLNNSAGNYRILLNMDRRQLGARDNTLIPRNLNVLNGTLVGAGQDGVINGPIDAQTGGSFSAEDQTVPSTRLGFQLNRRDVLTTNFPGYSAVLPNDNNTQSQIADVADYLSIYSGLSATLSGNSNLLDNSASLLGGGFTNQNGRFVTGGNVGGLKQARASAFGNAISNFGNNSNSSFGARRVNSRASSSGTGGTSNVTLNYNK